MAQEVHDWARFADFHIHNVDYKHVNGHPIPLSILVPKSITGTTTKKSFPWIAQFHGGYLITGARLYSPWFSQWLVNLAATSNAIIVTPDYRLLPEASGLDILADLKSFWDWVPEHLNKHLLNLYPGGDIQVDLDRLLVTGQSAGGYLAAQSALLHPELNIKSLILTYGMLDLRTPFWMESFEKPIFGAPQLPVSILEDHLKNMAPDAVITADGDPEKDETMQRMPLILSTVQNGRYVDVLGTDTVLFPVENVARATKLPPFVWLFHGKQDSAVPVEGTEAFANAVRSAFPQTAVLVDLNDGEHGYDTSLTAEVDWVREGLDKVKRYWL